MVLNRLSDKLNLLFDKDGKMSKSGKLDTELLLELDGIDYYQQPYPKSLGYEDFDSNWLPILNNSGATIADQMNTYCVHAAQIISAELNAQLKNGNERVLVTGGGAYHKYFISLLEEKFQGEVVVPSRELIEFKEAIIFGFLGVLRFESLTNCLSSVTGALQNSSGGTMTGF